MPGGRGSEAWGGEWSEVQWSGVEWNGAERLGTGKGVGAADCQGEGERDSESERKNPGGRRCDGMVEGATSVLREKEVGHDGIVLQLQAGYVQACGEDRQINDRAAG